METNMKVIRIAAQDTCFDVLGIDPDFETDSDDSVRETYEFLGAVGFGKDRVQSLAVDMTELS